MTDISIVPIDRLDLRFEPRPWAFADDRRAAIDANFAARRRKTPGVWNGRVLLMHEHAIVDGVLRGAFLETDYASFLSWGDFGYPPAGVRDCFACSALLAVDGGFLLGVMGDHTANAGRIYFPSGTPDANDVIDGRVDLDHSVRRELTEETGLSPDDLNADPGWSAVLAGPLLALIKVWRSADHADRLRSRILDHLAGEPQPELADIRIMRSPADFEPKLAKHSAAFMRHAWTAALTP
jgi:8-oxo-dGTP pyrophosphatase MutT (NUDIX family)